MRNYILFSDGSTLEVKDLNHAKNKLKSIKKSVSALVIDDVTIKVENLEYIGGAASSEYIEILHKSWKIRVWEDNKKYCCNILKGERVKYFEVDQSDVKSENQVFGIATQWVDSQ